MHSPVAAASAKQSVMKVLKLALSGIGIIGGGDGGGEGG